MMDFSHLQRKQTEKIINQALDAPSLKKQFQLAKKALQIDENCLDAYVILADHALSIQEAYDLLHEAVKRGEEQLADTFKHAHGRFWGVIETRPFMRAHLNLAIAAWQIGKPDEAIQILWKHLALNPNDNQGARHVLLGYLQAQKDDVGLDRLIQHYPGMEHIRDSLQTPMRLDRSIFWVTQRDSTRKALHQANVHSLQDLIDLPLKTLKSIPGIGNKTAPRLQASAYAFLQQQPYWWGAFPQDSLSPALLLDIRVHPDVNPQLPWGFCLKDPQGFYTIYLEDKLHLAGTTVQLDGITLVSFPDHQQIWAALLEQQTNRNLPLLGYGKQLRKHLKATAPKLIQKHLVLNDLHQILTDTVAFPTQTSGLQDIHQYLGHTGWNEDKKPYMAHMSYLWWIDKRKQQDLENAIHLMQWYVDALEHIHQWAQANYPHQAR